MSQHEHQVRERAYFIWEGEGRMFGRAEAHWLQAETELQVSLAPAPLRVQTSAPDLTLAPSPARVLGESLKAKPSRTRSVTATVETKVKTAARASAAKTVAPAEAAPAPAKSAKSATAKPAAGKSTAGKSTAGKSTAGKPAPVKAEPATKARTPKAAAHPRAEAAATVH